MQAELQQLLQQLSQKTKEGKLSWSFGFDDGQFFANVAPTSAAFVLELQSGQRRLKVLNEQQETILDEPIAKAAFDDILGAMAPQEPEIPLPPDAHAPAFLDQNLKKAEKLLAAV